MFVGTNFIFHEVSYKIAKAKKAKNVLGCERKEGSRRGMSWGKREIGK